MDSKTIICNDLEAMANKFKGVTFKYMLLRGHEDLHLIEVSHLEEMELNANYIELAYTLMCKVNRRGEGILFISPQDIFLKVDNPEACFVSFNETKKVNESNTDGIHLDLLNLNLAA